MTNEKMPMLLLGTLVGACVVAWWLGPVQADGIPTEDTLQYSGYLEEGGAPVNGTREIRVTFWDEADVEACTTGTESVAVLEGRFRIPLPDECVTAVRVNANLRVQVTVGTSTFPRERLSAVPYAVVADNGVAPGTIQAFGGTTPPDGWLLCNGDSVRRDEYPRLFAAIGTTWGTPPDDEHFVLPDLEGQFLRGAQAGSRGVGTWQDDTTRMPRSAFSTSGAGRHAHTFTNQERISFGDGGSFWYLHGNHYGENTSTEPEHSHGITGGDGETRPINYGVLYMIRAR